MRKKMRRKPSFRIILALLVLLFGTASGALAQGLVINEIQYHDRPRATAPRCA